MKRWNKKQHRLSSKTDVSNHRRECLTCSSVMSTLTTLHAVIDLQISTILYIVTGTVVTVKILNDKRRAKNGLNCVQFIFS